MLVLAIMLFFSRWFFSKGKKTSSTQWDTYLEIQIAMVDTQKKEDEKEENAEIKKIPGQMFKAGLYLVYSEMFNKIKPKEFGFETY